MIDLSFLTQEESEKIMAVLKRDAELKKAEEKRIQNLQRTVADKSQLKCLTGEWFYESKQLRHQECIHGSDIIRASIRRKSIPLTKVEVSHTLTKKSSFGTNERKGASEPSSPSRLKEEPNIAGYQNRDLQETSSNAAEVVLQSRPKWRQNPFNSEHTEAIKSQQLDGEMDLTLSENKSYAENIERSAWTKLSSRNLTSSRSLENLTSETTLALSSFSTMKSSVSSLSLQPQKMSSSRSSIYPLDTEVQGSIQFAVNYIQKLEEFQVFVVNCRGLAIAETKKNLSDPYVKCYLAPDKTRLGKKKTTVKKRTLNPTYNEVLKFKIPFEELKKQTLIVSVWHNDLFGRNSFLGDVDLNLSEWDFKNAEINEYKLKAKVSTEVIRGSHFGLQQNGGKMRVALRFIPKKIKSKGISTTEAGELLIWVKDCKDLPQVRRVIINPFVKCTVLPDTSRKSQQKTRVVKRTANPLFNHTMVYDGFQSEDLRQACVEITVWDRDRLHNHFIGGVRLGPGTGKSYGVDVAWMDSITTEVNLWNKMLHSNGEWVEDVLPLRMLVMAKGL